MLGAALALGALDYAFMTTMGNWPTFYSGHVSPPYFLIGLEASSPGRPQAVAAMAQVINQIAQRVPR